ncbi:DUF5708 family protein [Streptomyces sp. NPDC048623]|uniref:DUF5708 family protein n=1 Tax=Streptomyces sp. NPDC048623 TaxID=3155761 RepID=UPI003418AB05
MSRGTKNVLEGVAVFAVGLCLKLLTGDVDIPVLTLTKVGVVLMVVGAVTLVTGAVQTVHEARAGTPSRPAADSTADSRPDGSSDPAA